MTASEIVAMLETQFGAAITAKNAEALDPFVAVDPAKLVEVCTFLRDDPRLKFEILNDISGVDYLETDPKKAAKWRAEREKYPPEQAPPARPARR